MKQIDADPGRGRRRARSVGLVVSLAVAAAALVAASAQPDARRAVTRVAPHAAPASLPEAIVQISNFSFVPATLTITPGTKVTWVNGDDDPHRLLATNKLFRSAALDTHGRYSFTFAKPGVTTYFCTLHPQMIGKVIVKAR